MRLTKVGERPETLPRPMFPSASGYLQASNTNRRASHTKYARRCDGQSEWLGYQQKFSVRSVCDCVYGKARRISTARGTDPHTHLGTPYIDLQSNLVRQGSIDNSFHALRLEAFHFHLFTHPHL
jgi:hypothetical protein